MKILFILILFLAICLLVLYRLKDRVYLNKKTKDVLSQSVKNEIKKDKEDFLRRQTLFDQSLKKAQNKK
ncbi:MAG: hypothetical protein ACD_73C00080G0002 [uncultured bacterium]|nr:MAG: hypothetical protein ACD_73C00080G0002 [uncultured bacterium]